MTRTMPGPPEHDTAAFPHVDPRRTDAECALCLSEVDPAPWALSKRLSDAECAAEKWRALSSAMFLNWAPLDMLGVEIPADGQLYSVTRPDPTEAEIEADTWDRFAALPHALEMTP